MQWIGFGPFGLAFADGARLHHGIEYQVPSLDGAFRVSEGIEIVRSLNDSRKHRTFRQVKLPHVFSEVDLRSLAESLDRKAAALPEVDLVPVRFENLFLRKAVLQVKRHQDL